jgi:arylsulfatase A
MKKKTLDFVKASIGILFFLGVSFPTYSQKKPNVVFILADDLGYGDIGAYGQKLIETPHLDALASSGMKFNQFYAGTSVCAPSRAALLTGKHTGHTDVRGNYEIEPEGQLPLPDSAYTVGELFKSVNYSTGVFGKWGLGYPGSEGVPRKQGFDRFFGYNCQRESHNFFPGHLWDNDREHACSNTPADQREYAPELIQEQALKFIQTNADKPFFLFLTYTLPHAALQLKKDDKLLEHYKRKFREEPVEIPVPWNGKGYQPQPFPKSAYAAMVSKLDQYVGEVILKLKALGLEKETLIVFTSDNGPHQEGGNRPEHFNSSGGFRGIKRDLYEGGIRVPMIVSWPGVIRTGATSEFAGASWDFLPTFAEILGQPAPTAVDGISIFPTLKSENQKRKHDFLYWEFHEDGGRQAVRIGDWKGVRLNVKSDPAGPLQLYNLAADPFESTDVSTSHPDVVKEILQVMEREHLENQHFPFLPKT